jgi:cysteine synthase A
LLHCLESSLHRSRSYDTIVEGIGLDRVTGNFDPSVIDGAFRVSDREAVEMSRYLLRNDGLYLGASSAVHCVGAVRAARALGPGHTIVTVLCDGGQRYASRFWNDEALARLGIAPTGTGRVLSFLSDA